MLTLPNTTLAVSPLCCGVAELGTRVQGEAADRALGAFLEAGGSFFDTAHCYAFWVPGGLGASERELGDCLRRLGAGEEVVIATKGGHPAGGEGYPRPDRYLAPEVIAADVQDSLQRLARPRIDLYYLHRDDSRVPVGEIVEALGEQVRQGYVRYLGASNWTLARILEANAYAAAHGLPGFVISQLQWSLAVPTWEVTADPTMRYVTPEDAAGYAAAGLPLAAYSASAGGYFAGRDGGFHTPGNAARRERARDLAARRGVTPTQVALAWLLHQAPLVLPVIGALNAEHVREAVGALGLRLSGEEAHWLSAGTPATSGAGDLQP